MLSSQALHTMHTGIDDIDIVTLYACIVTVYNDNTHVASVSRVLQCKAFVCISLNEYYYLK